MRRPPKISTICQKASGDLRVNQRDVLIITIWVLVPMLSNFKNQLTSYKLMVSMITSKTTQEWVLVKAPGDQPRVKVVSEVLTSQHFKLIGREIIILAWCLWWCKIKYNNSKIEFINNDMTNDRDNEILAKHYDYIECTLL